MDPVEYTHLMEQTEILDISYFSLRNRTHSASANRHIPQTCIGTLHCTP